ncbi:sugar phosphate isomerase [Halobacillus andaensis]|uniref:Sugar phosphate isomerase n=1 Tax=Halobacillus andaensis TaxID=1176239 RepID=A0A917F0G8_HALAA|nr:sugar phosphate isomerase/epimerase [Halobacillus andaensis]MBP2005318.1 sugar phosphate isomerase/epimerase [Halobacillus andaensis]GGF30562.1 sugar phosphate isomerase [Halobacillus andaensis]
MNTIPVAVQLYTLREETEKDFEGTLRKVAELGFDGVEFAGLGDYTASEMKELLDDIGLRAASSHVPLEQIKNNLTQVIEVQKILGSKYIVCPYFEPQNENDYHQLIDVLKRAGEMCRLEGMKLCYHNHDFELKKQSDGRTALEMIFEETDPLDVKAEFDIYWLKKAGEDPIEWIKRYDRRTPLLHLKDMTTDEEQFFAELGTGGLDLDSVLSLGEQADVQWWVVEQDESRKTPLESLEISMNYLKTKLPHLTK